VRKKKIYILLALVLAMLFAAGFLHIRRIEFHEKGGVELKLGNTDRAIFWFRKSDKLGYRLAKYDLIDVYAIGIGTNPEKETALLLMKGLEKKEYLARVKYIIFSIENERFNDINKKDLEFWKRKLSEINDPQP
jgi:hypothetical protein